MKKQFIFLCLILVSALTSFSQTAPIKYGKIDKNVLEMKVYEHDTGAPALVLCDYGYYNSELFQTRKLLRIKVLKKEGLEYGNQILETLKSTSVRGVTYNIVNGEIVESKLKNESVFETNVYDSYYITRVSMPDVKVGSVIDLEYTFDLIPIEWEFQREIPVEYSELYFESSGNEFGLEFSTNYFGFEPLNISTGKHWIGKNMPAFKPEPFINSSKNYCTRLEFDIISISNPGYSYYAIAKSWETLGIFLENNNHFGLALDKSAYLNKIADEIKLKTNSDEEKIKMAYDIACSLKWDGMESVFTSNLSVGTCYNDKKGNSADINILLVQLLDKLDYNAFPVVLSTRENGLLSKFNPSLYKLNYVIAALILEQDTILMDATQEYSPYYLLPPRAMNINGRLMGKKDNLWIDVAAIKKNKILTIYNLTLDENMQLSGTISKSWSDYAAVEYRNKYHKFNNEEEFLDDFKKDKQGLKIIEFETKNLDSIYLPVTEEYKVVIADKVDDLYGEYLFYPLLFDWYLENPFKDTERIYPVNFDYPFERSVIANFTLPEEYMISSMPTPVSFKLPDKNATFSYQIAANNNTIQVVYKLVVNKDTFLQMDYPDLREFINQVIIKQSEPVIIKKI